MDNYTVIKGDATQPNAEGMKLIPHVCNNIGAWGAGFVLALSRKWKKPEQLYKKWYREGYYQKPGRTNLTPFRLGEIQAVKVASDIAVVNMIGQEGIGGTLGRPPIRYGSLGWAMLSVKNLAVKHKASIHCPMFGSALAGGNWDVIEQMIFECWTDYEISVTVYQFP